MNYIFKAVGIAYILSISLFTLSMELENEYKGKGMTFILDDIKKLLPNSPTTDDTIPDKPVTPQELKEIQEANDRLMEDLINEPSLSNLAAPLVPQSPASSPIKTSLPPSSLATPPTLVSSEPPASSASTPNNASPINPPTNNPPDTCISKPSSYYPFILTGTGAFILCVAYTIATYKRSVPQTSAIEPVEESPATPSTDQTILIK